MGAGHFEKVEGKSISTWRSSAPLRHAASTVYIPPLRSSSSSNNNGDRFIPNRSAMDFDFAHCMLTEPRTEASAAPASTSVYRKLLSDVLFNKRTRLFSYQNKPPAPTDRFSSPSPFDEAPSLPSKLKKKPRFIPVNPQSAEWELYVPDVVDDFNLNLLDWGSRNILSIALENTVSLLDYSAGSYHELLRVGEEGNGPVTSISWAPDGEHLALGLQNSDVVVCDSTNRRLVRTLRGVHQSRVGSLAWNDNILTTGGMDGKVVNNDVRIRSHAVLTYRGHTQEVCGLKWSGSGQLLASGGSDNLVHIWDLAMASSFTAPNQHRWVHRFEDHTDAVKALAWCPFQSSLLASGGGSSDRCIKFWNTQTGACLNSLDTGSQVSSLLWNKNERELLSAHRSPDNQMTLWKYPSMAKMADIVGHKSRVRFMAQSPNGCTVASEGGDTLIFWNVFGDPDVPKPKPKAKASAGPFSSYYHLR